MSNEETKALLIIGIGNSGRSDDGLGWLLLDRIKNEFGTVDLLYRYQLQIEDAELLSHYPSVIFIDATRQNCANGFYFKKCHPNNGIGLTSHMLEPETIVWLEKKLYMKNPLSYVMGIEGEKWSLSLQPSDSGLSNLSKATDLLRKNIKLILTDKKPLLL